MDNQAEGQELLEWPTPEMLAAAHRARNDALREMVVAGARWFRRLIADQVLALSLGRAKVTIANAHVAHRR